MLLGAHLDSWDVGQGAHDDGQGCAVIVEALRTLKSLGERCSLEKHRLHIYQLKIPTSVAELSSSNGCCRCRPLFTLGCPCQSYSNDSAIPTLDEETSP